MLELLALEVLVDRQHPIDDEIRTRKRIGREPVQAQIGIQGIVRVVNPSEQAVILKDDLVLRIRIFNLVGPFPCVLTVRVESRCAWESSPPHPSDLCYTALPF